MKNVARMVAEILVAFLLLLAVNEMNHPRVLGPADSVELSGAVMPYVNRPKAWRM